MELNKLIHIERLQRAGASEREILFQLGEPEPRRETSSRLWRRLGSTLFVAA